MSLQELAAYGLVGLAALYLAWRLIRKDGGEGGCGNCPKA